MTFTSMSKLRVYFVMELLADSPKRSGSASRTPRRMDRAQTTVSHVDKADAEPPGWGVPRYCLVPLVFWTTGTSTEPVPPA